MRTKLLIVVAVLLAAGTLAVLTVSEAPGQPQTIRVVTPVAGAVFEPGATVEITVESDGGVESVMALAPGVVVNGAGSSVQLQLPEELLGPMELAIFVRMVGGGYGTAFVSIEVEEAATELSALEVSETVRLRVGEVSSLSIVGRLSDSREIDIGFSTRTDVISLTPRVCPFGSGAKSQRTGAGRRLARQPGTAAVTTIRGRM